MKTTRIYKYSCPIEDELTINLPRGAEILTVQMQHGVPQLWCAIDTSAPSEPAQFHWAGTGHETPTGKYIGTVQLNHGALMFHLFRAYFQ